VTPTPMLVFVRAAMECSVLVRADRPTREHRVVDGCGQHPYLPRPDRLRPTEIRRRREPGCPAADSAATEQARGPRGPVLSAGEDEYPVSGHLVNPTTPRSGL